MTVIRPPTGWAAVNLGDVWRYRGLLYFLLWSDIKVQYKQTALGAAWAIIQPLITMVVFSVVFGELADLPSDGIPYPVFAYSALVPWSYFANALSQVSGSLHQYEEIITKVYFPRLIVPTASVLSGLIDFAIAFAVLIVLMVGYGIVPTIAVVALPFFVLLAAATALAVGLWLASFGIQYRDVGYAVPFLVQLWFFITPIVYPSSLVPDRWQVLYGLNPMAGVVEGFRWALLGREEAPGLVLIASTLTVIVLLIGGLFHFQRKERVFADVV